MKDANFLRSNGVNVEKSLELFGDMETYNETLKTFLIEVDEKLTKIDKFKQVADMANYAILVHSLKSDAKYFGFEKLAELAYQHELESKANHIYFVYENYGTLINEANRIVSLINEYFGKEYTPKVIVTENVGKSILVVDDSDVIGGFIKRVFNGLYDVILAKNGREAIGIMLTSDHICGMLLDLNMPDVDGFGVLEYMKKNDLFKRIPTSIITGVGDESIVSHAFEYPIVDVLRKPFNERDVKTVVEKTVK